MKLTPRLMFEGRGHTVSLSPAPPKEHRGAPSPCSVLFPDEIEDLGYDPARSSGFAVDPKGQPLKTEDPVRLTTIVAWGNSAAQQYFDLETAAVDPPEQKLVKEAGLNSSLKPKSHDQKKIPRSTEPPSSSFPARVKSPGEPRRLRPMHAAAQARRVAEQIAEKRLEEQERVLGLCQGALRRDELSGVRSHPATKSLRQITSKYAKRAARAPAASKPKAGTDPSRLAKSRHAAVKVVYDTKSPAEREQHRTSLLPGPGTYNPQDCPGRVRVRGGQFQPRKPPIEELWALKRAAGVPDPGTYTLKSTVEKVAGGRFNPGTKPLTGDDWALKRASQTPGPGEYKLKTSVDLIIAQPTGRFISGVP